MVVVAADVTAAQARLADEKENSQKVAAAMKQVRVTWRPWMPPPLLSCVLRAPDLFHTGCTLICVGLFSTRRFARIR